MSLTIHQRCRATVGGLLQYLRTASLTQRMPDWLAGRCEALAFFGGVLKSIVYDNLKASVAKPLWFTVDDALADAEKAGELEAS